MTHGEETPRGNDLALVEAALFLASRPLTRRALAKILGDVPLAYVDQLQNDLRDAYADATKGIELVVEEGRALLRVKAPYVDRVAHLAPQQDIPQPVLRTLAVIAYNHPATQADVVRTRGNKAYEHIHDLVERGLVRGEEHGRTLLLHVTDEFLRHFGLSTIDEFRFHVAVPADDGHEPASESQEVSDG
jgi:segregation and condensation protein B